MLFDATVTKIYSNESPGVVLYTLLVLTAESGEVVSMAVSRLEQKDFEEAGIVVKHETLSGKVVIPK